MWNDITAVAHHDTRWEASGMRRVRNLAVGVASQTSTFSSRRLSGFGADMAILPKGSSQETCQTRGVISAAGEIDDCLDSASGCRLAWVAGREGSLSAVRDISLVAWPFSNPISSMCVGSGMGGGRSAMPAMARALLFRTAMSSTGPAPWAQPSEVGPWPMQIDIYDEPDAPEAAFHINNILIVARDLMRSIYFSVRFHDKDMQPNLLPEEKSLLDPRSEGAHGVCTWHVPRMWAARRAWAKVWGRALDCFVRAHSSMTS